MPGERRRVLGGLEDSTGLRGRGRFCGVAGLAGGCSSRVIKLIVEGGITLLGRGIGLFGPRPRVVLGEIGGGPRGLHGLAIGGHHGVIQLFGRGIGLFGAGPSLGEIGGGPRGVHGLASGGPNRVIGLLPRSVSVGCRCTSSHNMLVDVSNRGFEPSGMLTQSSIGLFGAGPRGVLGEIGGEPCKVHGLASLSTRSPCSGRRRELLSGPAARA